MYLFSLDFSQNNLLKEQININSLYLLPVVNKLLIEQQLVNFADLSIEKAYLINCKNYIDFSVFNTVAINENELFKEIALISDNEKFIAFRNDVYFETNNLSLKSNKNDELVLLHDENGLGFCVTGSVSKLKRLYNKNMSLSDFFKFPEKFTYCSEEVQKGYVCYLKSIKNYKDLLIDILNGKTHSKPPFVAEGIFTAHEVPKGDFSIVPPVYLGESVQIESGSVIGPNVVIYNDTLISENTTIKNSVLFEKVFVSSNCFVDGTVCCYNASIKRNSAVFAGSVIGENALIGEDITLENNSLINRNVNYGNPDIFNLEGKKKFSLNNKFQGISPDKSVLLGSAVSVVFKEPKIIVGCDCSSNSLSLKLAFISGLIASGSECIDVGVTFKSQMYFFSLFCDCDYSVFFSCLGGGTNIEIFDSENRQLSKSQCCNLFDYCNKGEFVYKNADECKSVRQIKGLRKMYICEIVAFSEENLPCVDVECENLILLKTIEDIFKRCIEKERHESALIIYVNENGTNVNIKYRDKIYQQKILKKLVHFFQNKEERFNIFESDFYKKSWRNDSVFLVVAVLNIIKRTGKDLAELISELPLFYIKSQNINLKFNDSELAEKIGRKFIISHKKGCFNVRCNKGYIKIKNNKEKGEIKIFSASQSMAVSKEICDFFAGLLQGL